MTGEPDTTGISAEEKHGAIRRIVVMALCEIAQDNSLLEVARAAIEEALIDFRDSRLSECTRANGLVIREANGKPSDIIRFGPEHALRIGLLAIANHTRPAIATQTSAEFAAAVKPSERVEPGYDEINAAWCALDPTQHIGAHPKAFHDGYLTCFRAGRSK